jgi:PEGA domain
MVDGKFSGNTPSTLHISAGDHKLTITNKGFQNWVRDITLSPGGTITVNAVLEPESAK